MGRYRAQEENVRGENRGAEIWTYGSNELVWDQKNRRLSRRGLERERVSTVVSVN